MGLGVRVSGRLVCERSFYVNYLCIATKHRGYTHLPTGDTNVLCHLKYSNRTRSHSKRHRSVLRNQILVEKRPCAQARPPNLQTKSLKCPTLKKAVRVTSVAHTYPTTMEFTWSVKYFVTIHASPTSRFPIRVTGRYKMTTGSRDYYQPCDFCGKLVDSYNAHALIRKKNAEPLFFHVRCVQNTNHQFSEQEITYVNMWCELGGVK